MNSGTTKARFVGVVEGATNVSALFNDVYDSITADDFAFAAGYGMASYGKRVLNSSSHQKFNALAPRYRKQAEGFLNYLLFLSEKEKKSKGNK